MNSTASATVAARQEVNLDFRNEVTPKMPLRQASMQHFCQASVQAAVHGWLVMTAAAFTVPLQLRR